MSMELVIRVPVAEEGTRNDKIKISLREPGYSSVPEWDDLTTAAANAAAISILRTDETEGRASSVSVRPTPGPFVDLEYIRAAISVDGWETLAEGN